MTCSVLLLGAAVTAPAAPEPRPPRIFPDYSGAVIPPNIAPLNFRVEEPGARYQVRIHSTKGQAINVATRSSSISIPPRPWRALLRDNVGEPLYFEVSVQDQQRQWRQFTTITNTIAPEDIDGYLVYRLLRPLFNVYVTLGIYQRELAGFKERPVLENRSFGGGCLNCHTFLNQRADTFALNIRGGTGFRPMLLVLSNRVMRVDKTAGYLAWHPSGRLIAFSGNRLSLLFHTTGETRDVFDAESNLGIYRVDSNLVEIPPPIALPERNETWPSWAPDGQYLYYCSAPKLPFQRYRQVHYDLMRISFDLQRNQWGEPETLVAAKDTGLSAGQPRVSPDGRWLLFCLYNYGNFPVYQPGSDLYLMDLNTRQYRRLDINSPQAESWHCWSGNSRWVVFSSKRLDGLFARPHFSYVDQTGQLHKPFLLPQEDPAFYDTCLNTYNVPELVREPVRVPPAELSQAAREPGKRPAPNVAAQQ